MLLFLRGLLGLGDLLASRGHALLGGIELAGQSLDLLAGLVALLLHGGQLVGQRLGVVARGGLGSQLVDLRVELLDLTFELVVLGGQGLDLTLGLGQETLGLGIHGRLLGGITLGLLQIPVFCLQGFHLSRQVRDLGVQRGHVGTQGLGGSGVALHGLLAQGFNRVGDLIQEVVNLVDVVAFLEPHCLEGMLPYVIRRQ